MSLKIALAQQNFTVGDVRGNAAKIIETVRFSHSKGAVLVVFPELAVTGYPSEDLLLRRDYLDASDRAVKRIATEIDEGIDVIIGAPMREGEHLFNAALHLSNRRVVNVYRKRNLPNYDVFDEKRYFKEGHTSGVFTVAGQRLGVTICEDIWDAVVTADAKRGGANCIVNINASPFHIKKQAQRERVLRRRYTETGLPLVYVNLVGGQDELVFDGNSVVFNQNGDNILRAPSFAEEVYFCDPFASDVAMQEPAPQEIELIRRACVMGLSDYVLKNGFEGLVVGLSGGIDSAVSLMIAIDAVGAKRVKAVTMPSPYTASEGIEDVYDLAHTLGVGIVKVPITNAFDLMCNELGDACGDRLTGTGRENLQARIRACFLMAISNCYRLMVVSTSNKSELAVGYTTLYGDMIGGYAPLKDVFKTQVYELARYYNRQRNVIPQNIINRSPSAELAPKQKDSDSLPPYPLLDRILEELIENDASCADLAAGRFDTDTVYRVQQMLVNSEYKRRQGVPGVKITPRAFGKDRRYPVSCCFDFGS